MYEKPDNLILAAFFFSFFFLLYLYKLECTFFHSYIKRGLTAPRTVRLDSTAVFQVFSLCSAIYYVVALDTLGELLSLCFQNIGLYQPFRITGYLLHSQP